VKHRQFRRATWCGAVAALVGAIACATTFVNASQQTPLLQNPAGTSDKKSIPVEDVFSASPEIDALAERLAQEISRRRYRNVAVFGAMGPDDRVTELGESAGDTLSRLLAAGARKFTVVDRKELRDILHNQRVAQTELMQCVLSQWLAHQSHIEAFVCSSIKSETGNNISLHAYLFEAANYRPTSRFSAHVDMQVDQSHQSASRRIVYRTNDALPRYSLNQVHGDYTFRPFDPSDVPWTRDAGINDATVVVTFTVTPEGKADDIEVSQPAGLDLDRRAVKSVLESKFKPIIGKDGQPISVMVVEKWIYKRTRR
jgi:TonB family protein